MIYTVTKQGKSVVLGTSTPFVSDLRCDAAALGVLTAIGEGQSTVTAKNGGIVLHCHAVTPTCPRGQKCE